MSNFIEKCTEFSRDFELEQNRPDYDFLFKTAKDFMQEEVKETIEAIYAKDHAEMLDGFGDVAFIALNGIYKTARLLGKNHEEATNYVYEVMERICTANLGKKQDGKVVYKDGKVQKPEGWKAPVYHDLV